MEKEQIIDLANSGKYAEVRNALFPMQPADIAEIIEEIKDDPAQLRLFRILPKDIAAETFADLHPDTQEEFISKFSNVEISNIITSSFIDDTIDIIEDMPENVIERILSVVPKDTRATITKVLAITNGEDNAGGLLTTEFIKLTPQNTVKQAFDKIRKEGKDAETVSTCYVVDAAGKLAGQVNLQDMLFAQPQKTMGALMSPATIQIHDTDDQEDVANQFSKYHVRTLPVVDGDERLIGIITADDIVDVIREEATEDIQAIAKIIPTEKPYLQTSVWKHAGSRIIWLIILMVSAIPVGMLISSYENALVLLPILVSFIPMLMDTGGNCGSQSAALMIRGTSLGEIKPKDFFRVFLTETMVSMLIGLAMAAFNIVRIWIQYGDVLLGVAVGLTLIVVVTVANLLGVALTLLIKRLKMDPAIMAAPIITTIADLVSIFIYFSIATAILPQL